MTVLPACLLPVEAPPVAHCVIDPTWCPYSEALYPCSSSDWMCSPYSLYSFNGAARGQGFLCLQVIVVLGFGWNSSWLWPHSPNCLCPMVRNPLTLLEPQSSLLSSSELPSTLSVLSRRRRARLHPPRRGQVYPRYLRIILCVFCVPWSALMLIEPTIWTLLQYNNGNIMSTLVNPA